MRRMILERQKVYDPVLRTIHLWNALSITLLLLGSSLADWLEFTPEATSLWRLHVLAGYALVLGLVARLTWGLIGPAHARLAELWQPCLWIRALRRRDVFASPGSYGHHAPATAVYLLLYLILLVMALTGLALAAIDQGRGPFYPWLAHDVLRKSLFREPHEWLENVVLGFVVVHIAALILHEVRHGVPLAQAMVSGYQYLKVDKEKT